MSTATEDAAVTEEAAHARDWLAVHGLPTGREEAWRYAPVDELRRRFDTLASAADPDVEARLTDLERLAGRHGPMRIVVVDGVHSPTLSDTEVPAGLWCGTRRSLSSSLREHLTTPMVDPPDGFEALNRSVSDVVYLQIADGTDLADPVHVVHVSTGARAAHPRAVVDVGIGSRLHLIETHVAMDGGGATNASTAIRLARDATLTAHRVQDDASDAAHVGRLELHQEESSSSDVTVLMRGAHAARMTTSVRLAGRGASCRVTALMSPRPAAWHDHAITIDHVASECTSDLVDRSVVAEHARTSSTGHVIVRADTVGTVAHQRTDNLLLHRSAQADSRPWLEIFADDVRANHGSATGRLDEDAIFYLRSRGIPLDQARQMLTRAFAGTIVERLQPASLRAQVAGWFDQEDVT